MNHELLALLTTAASVGVVHTLLGPDHYLPFVAMSRAAAWSLRRTLLITLVCGVGHVLGSVVIGVVGLGIGAAVLRSDRVDGLSELEGTRGEFAGWMLIAFGAAYLIWGVRRSIRNRPHAHLHAHADGTVHAHEHTHEGGHLHVHVPVAQGLSHAKVPPKSASPGVGEPSKMKPGLTPWILFVIFLFGPCEALIPVLMLPAALHGGAASVAIVTAVFAIATISTMTTVVAAGYLGLSARVFSRVERHAQAIAGGLVLACGVAIKAGL